MEGQMMFSDAADKVLEHVPDDVREVLREFVMASFECHTQRLGEIVQMCTITEHMTDFLKYTDDYLTASFRQMMTKVAESPVTEYQESVVPVEKDCHSRVLQIMFGELSKNLKVEGNTLLDILIQDEVMSEAGKSSILSRPTTDSKNKAFITFCARQSSTTFSKHVLPALKNCNDVGNEELAKMMEGKLSDPFMPTRTGDKCNRCLFQDKVSIRKLSDELYSRGVITNQQRDDLMSPSVSQSNKWEVIFKVKDVALIDSVKKICPELNVQNLMICTCEDEIASVELGTSDVACISEVSSLDYCSKVTSPLDISWSPQTFESANRSKAQLSVHFKAGPLIGAPTNAPFGKGQLCVQFESGHLNGTSTISPFRVSKSSATNSSKRLRGTSRPLQYGSV